MADYITSIMNHAINSSTARSFEKGKSVFDKQGLELIHLNLPGESASFGVQGTRLYHVDIFRFVSGKVQTKCNCPYDWGGLCKHEVASLLYLAKHLKGDGADAENQARPAQKFTVKRSAASPYLIPEYIPFNDIYLRQHISPIEIHIVRNVRTVDLIEYHPYNLRYKVEVWNYNASFYDREQLFEVLLKEEEGALSIQCDCGKQVEQLCAHGYAVLNYIHEYCKPDFLKVLNSGSLEKLKKSTCDKSGIPIDLFDDFFEIAILNNEVKVKAVNAGQGFLTSEMIDGFEIGNQAEENKWEKHKISLPVKITEEQEEPYFLGFIISFHDFEYNTGTPTIEIKPFMAKKGKITSLKNFTDYDSAQNVMVSDDQALILHKIEELEDLTSAGFENAEHRKLIFHKTDELFALLENESFTYLQFKASGRSKISKGSLKEIDFSSNQVEASFELKEEPYFYNLVTLLKINTQVFDLSSESNHTELLPFFVVEHKGTLHLFKNLEQALIVQQAFQQTPVLKTAKKDFDRFFERIITPLSKHFPINISDMEHLEKHTIHLEPQKRELYLSELSNFVLFQPVVKYDNGVSQNIKEPGSILEKKGDVIYQYLRDLAYEEEFQQFLYDLNDNFAKQTHSPYHFLTYDDFIKRGWIFDAFEKLKKAGIEVYGINELKGLNVSPHKASISTHLKSGQDWFDVKISISFGDYEVKLSDVRKAVLRKERYVKLGDGKLGLLPEEWVEKLSRYFRAGEVDEEGVKISKLKFNLIDELFDEIDNEKIILEIAEKKERLRSFKEIKSVDLPAGITAELRDYQKEGYNWLNFLEEFKWGGILADDMGLGKTLQILSFLMKQVETNDIPNLVVIPTSLLFNWENEINKFTPSLKALIHYGKDRRKDVSDFNDYNLIITSYGIMVKDVEMLKSFTFNYIVLDESQAIKNPGSLRYKAACVLNANNRLTMTGTPVENNTFDLYAQINFLNPGFLGSQPFFKDQYSIPIDRDGDEERAGELQRLINPFLLRRTKEIVAKELPPKIEDIIYCEMPDEQMKIYEAYRNKYRDLLLKKIDEDGVGKSKMYVLEGLMKLRQICDSPELLSDMDDFGSTSVKIQVLMQHIQEKTGNHKILIFSQFVKMLRVIERELQGAGLSYEYLDGQCSQKKRKASVENFQENDDCRVFLISLKAGGTGLNLTAADYVYIVDPWWNPAVENQAIDRCHRIGQDKHVIAYRMICKNTVEEKIMKYQAKKLKIASDIITTDESFMKQLGKSDISELFG
jgi:superfamily II DNA or RNA helicase